MWGELERPAIIVTNIKIINLHKERGIAFVGVRVSVGIEPRDLHKLGALSATEPHP